MHSSIARMLYECCKLDHGVLHLSFLMTVSLDVGIQMMRLGKIHCNQKYSLFVKLRSSILNNLVYECIIFLIHPVLYKVVIQFNDKLCQSSEHEHQSSAAAVPFSSHPLLCSLARINITTLIR